MAPTRRPVRAALRQSPQPAAKPQARAQRGGPSGDRGDRVRSQELAQGRNLDLKIVLLDDESRPDPVEELGLRHQLSGALD
jgi:hypothetical protein